MGVSKEQFKTNAVAAGTLSQDQADTLDQAKCPMHGYLQFVLVDEHGLQGAHLFNRSLCFAAKTCVSCGTVWHQNTKGDVQIEV